MHRDSKTTKSVIAIVLIVFGVAFGVNWNKTGFCLGDQFLSFLGLPAWSQGTQGLHYPGIIGSLLVLAGIGLVNTTHTPKTRRLIWGAALLVVILLNVIFTYR